MQNAPWTTECSCTENACITKLYSQAAWCAVNCPTMFLCCILGRKLSSLYCIVWHKDILYPQSAAPAKTSLHRLAPLYTCTALHCTYCMCGPRSNALCFYFWAGEKLTVFKASALWADAFYKSICPSVCLCVCLSVCSLLRYRLTVFLPPLPEVGCPIFLEIRNPWGKVMERSGLTFEHFGLEVV